MNKNTMIIVGIGAAALLFLFRKQIFGGGNGGDNGGGSEDTTPDTSGPSENVDVPTETGGDTVLKPFAPPVPTKRPDIVNVNPTTVNPNTTVNPKVDSAVFFSAPNPFALGSK